MQSGDRQLLLTDGTDSDDVVCHMQLYRAQLHFVNPFFTMSKSAATDGTTTATDRRAGMTRRIVVWLAEKPTTLLSIRPAARAAAITSTSRSVAARPLRKTTQIPPPRLEARPELGQAIQVGGLVRAHEDQV